MDLKKQKAEKLQAIIDKVKAEVYSGELDPSLYYSSLTGILSAELIGAYDYLFNTDLDLSKLKGAENETERA